MCVCPGSLTSWKDLGALLLHQKSFDLACVDLFVFCIRFTDLFVFLFISTHCRDEPRIPKKS